MPVDLSNIQGNIVSGFNTNFQCFLGLRREPGAEAIALRSWVSGLADKATSARAVRDQRAAMRDTEKSVGMTWLMVGFGFSLLSFLRPDATFNSVPYRNGFLARRRSVMSDESDPSDWAAGGPSTEIDVLLIIAGNDREAVENEVNLIETEAAALGVVRSYREFGIRLPGDKEHFGFRDGISQPTVDLEDSSQGTPAGQFLFGHEDIDAQTPSALFMSTPAALSTDGTMMVFRRLLQDVAAFEAFRDAETTRLQTAWPGLQPEHLAALVVGRWPEGQLAVAGAPNPPNIPPALNDFDFSDDPEGTGCPFTAHIRKVNPRNGGGDVTLPERHRFLRRGIPFGQLFEEEPNGERGLLFVAFQTDIASQVDFVTRAWMNSHDRPNVGNDLLVGRGFAPQHGKLTIRQDGNEFDVVADENRWVIPNGGGYFYVPSIAGLKTISEAPEGVVMWRVRRAMGLTRNALQSFTGSPDH